MILEFIKLYIFLVFSRFGYFSHQEENVYQYKNNIVIYSLLSPLCRVLAIAYLQQTMTLLYIYIYIFLQLFCMYNFCPWNLFCTFTLAPLAVCVQCPIRLFSVAAWFNAFPVCSSDTVWMIFRTFQLPLLLPVSLCFHIPHALSLYYKFFIFYNLLSFSLDDIFVSRNCNIC
jgi:hypothetical protein